MSEAQKLWWLAGAAAVGFLLYLLGPVLTPFLIGAGLAYLGDPVADWLERRGLSRTLAVVVVFTTMVLVAVAALAILLPLLQHQLVVFGRKLPAYFDWLQREVVPWLQRRLGVADLTIDLDSMRQAVTEHWQQLGGASARIVAVVTQSWLALIAWLANLVLIPLVAFYLLRDWDRLMAYIEGLLPRRNAPVVVRLARECDAMLGHFLRGQVSVMVALGLVYSVGLWWVGLELALLIGLFAGLVSFVPYLGFILGILIAGITAVMQFHDAAHVVQVALVFGAGQLLESFVFTPLLLGDRIGIHPVVVIFAVMAGGQLFGFVGVLLALPVAAVAGVLLRHVHERYLGSRLYAGDQDPD